MYADDTVLLSKGSTLSEAIHTNQLLFDQYIRWANVHCLNINVSKTKQMSMCSRYKTLPDPIPMISKDGKAIHNTHNYVYLGGDVDCNMTFELFLKAIIRKVNHKLYSFS